jgi:hypothetical protein
MKGKIMTDTGLKFHVPRANQGQIVEYSYASTGDGDVIERRYDRSDRQSSYQIAEMDPDDEGDYWNGAPRISEWRDLTDEQLSYYGLG